MKNYSKKVISIILSFVMLFTCITGLEISIYATSASGKCGNLDWVLDEDGTLTISGSGDIYAADYSYSWLRYESSLKNVVIETGAMTISEFAFKDCSNLKSVTIPDTVTRIESYAFWNCESLTSIVIPSSVTNIGSYVFSNCKSLTDVRFNSSYGIMGVELFSGCESLTNIVIPNGWTMFYLGETFCTDCISYYDAPNEKDFLISHTKQTGITESNWKNKYYKYYSFLNDPNANDDDLSFYELYTLCEQNIDCPNKEISDLCVDTLEKLNKMLSIVPELEKNYDPSVAKADDAYKALRTAIGATTLKAATTTVETVGNFEYNGTPIKDLEGDDYKEGIKICNSALEYIGVDFEATNPAEALMYYYVLPTGYDYTLNNANANSKAITFVNAMLYAKLAEDGGKAISGVTIPTKAPTDPFSFAKDVYTKLFDANGSATIASTRSYDTFCSSSFEAINKRILLLSGDYADMEAVNTAIEQAQISETDLEDLKAHTVDGDLSSLYNYIFSDDCKLTKYEKEFFDLLYKGDTTHSEFSLFNNELYASVDNAKAYKLNKATTLRDASKLRNSNVIMSAVDFYNNICSGIMTRLDVNSGKNIPSATFVSKSSFDFIEVNKYNVAIKPYVENLVYRFNDYIDMDSLYDLICTEIYTAKPSCIYGYTQCQCNSCGKTFYKFSQPTNEHSFLETVIPPTESSHGYTIYKCEYCESSYTDDYIEFVNGGFCGRDVKWCFYSDGTLLFSGTGEMYSYSSTQYPWYEYHESVKNVVLDDGITSIGSYAFKDCKSLTSVVIPDSVRSIGNYVFYNCTSLTNVVIPDGVTSIYSYTFGYCTALTSVVIPASVRSIGDNAFYKCTSLTNVVIPDGVTSINSNTFFDCTSLTSVVIPASVRSIGNHAFYNCTSLTNVVIPDGVTSIDSYTFGRCTALTSVVIPDSVISIGNSAFCNCTSLMDVYYKDSQKKWDSISFGLDNTCLTDANIHYNYVPLCVHSFVVTDELSPTCTNEGYVLFRCKECGFSFNEYLDALGHSYKFVNYRDGILSYECRDCDKHNTKLYSSLPEFDEHYNEYVIRGKAGMYIDLNNDGVINAKDYVMLRNIG